MELEVALRKAAPGVEVSTRRPDQRAYSRDLWPRGLIELQAGEPEPPGPAAVVWPSTVAQVVDLVRFAAAEGFSLVPFGAGSGVCGAVLPSSTSVVVDLKRFSGFSIGVGPELQVGAGVLGITLEESLEREGFTTGHFPSSILCSTVGGWVAARGAGQCSGRYGKIEDMVTSLDVVLGTAQVVHARRRLRGPDLVPLLIGSEGTLGIITRVGLRLHAAPSARAFAAFSFANVEAGIRGLRLLYQEGLRPAVARLYDPLDTFVLSKDEGETKPPAHPPGHPGWGAEALRAVLSAPTIAARAMLAAEATLASRVALVLVHEGDAASVERESRRATTICASVGASSLGESAARAWFRHRYHVSYRQAPLFRSGVFVDTMEVAAPWSRLPDVYHTVRRALGRHVLVMAHFSHSYPDGGSIYFTFAGRAHGERSAVQVYDDAWRVGLSAALDAGATLSHHHGVGRNKAPRLGEESAGALRLLRALKRAWDPAGILNPGALLPAPSSAETRPVRAAESEPVLDAESDLVELPGALAVGAAEAWLGERGRTLALDPEAFRVWSRESVDAWIAAGLPGIRDAYADPAGTRLSGCIVRLSNGERIGLRAAPRRAVGPDVTRLFVGAEHAFGSVESAMLGAPRSDAGRPEVFSYAGEREPPVDSEERLAWDALEAALV